MDHKVLVVLADTVGRLARQVYQGSVELLVLVVLVAIVDQE